LQAEEEGLQRIYMRADEGISYAMASALKFGPRIERNWLVLEFLQIVYKERWMLTARS
jgi:hypothetical protein